MCPKVNNISSKIFKAIMFLVNFKTRSIQTEINEFQNIEHFISLLNKLSNDYYKLKYKYNSNSFRNVRQSGVALTQLSLTLHNNSGIFYYQNPGCRNYAARQRALQIFLHLADKSSKRNII